MKAQNKNIISVERLSVGYPKQMLFQDITFELSENQLTAVLGLNGTGKSTFIRTLCGLQNALSGKIKYQNRPLYNIPNAERSQLFSIVLSGKQDVLPALKVIELLRIARTPYTGIFHQLKNNDEAIIEETIQTLHLEHLLTKKLFELSDGQLQKVFIAKALVQQTPFLFLDEPTSYLDIINKMEIFQLIKSLKETGKTIIFSTHEAGPALQIADNCFLMKKTGIFEFASVHEILRDKKIDNYFSNAEIAFNYQTLQFEAVNN